MTTLEVVCTETHEDEAVLAKVLEDSSDEPLTLVFYGQTEFAVGERYTVLVFQEKGKSEGC